ncbi:MAG: RDD family protein [Verrucomicrobia subdivision 3 bacterium]|nr:RDD family protein [Limisphaerales bacterium]
MNTEILRQVTSLGVTLLIALLVWSFYKRKTVALSERYSTFGPRFWTGSVDSCVLWPIGLITTGLLSFTLPRTFAALLVIVESLAWLLYTVVMHARYGQTVGKMVTKVRVVDFRTEGSISWRQAWLREGIPMVLSLGFLGWEVFLILTGSLDPSTLANGEALLANKGFWLLTVLPGLWFVAEVLTMLTNEKRRALHDFIAGTVVVRTNTEDRIAKPDDAPKDDAATPLGISIDGH